MTAKIDEEAVTTKIVALRKEVIGLKNDKDALRKANKEGAIGADEFAKGITKANLAINAANKSIRENERTLENSTKAQQAAAGSITQMRANVSLLTADYVALSKEERKNAEVGGVLKDKIKELNDELKAEEGAYGDNRRAIGGYSEAIEKAISGNTTFVSTLRNSATSLREAKDNTSQYIKGLRATTEGMGGVQKASVAMGLGLKAIGIGLLLTAITGLIAFLSKMDAGMDKVEQATAALSAGFEAFIQTVAPIGELLVDTFTHPLDSIAKLGNALLHPIDSFNAVRAASKKMSDDIAKNVGRAANAAVEYTKTQQDLEDAQDGLILQQAQVNAAVGKALIAAKDGSKTQKERIRLLDVAEAGERKLAKAVLKIREDDLKSLIKFQASKTQLEDADRKKLLEVKAAAVNAGAEAEETEQKIQNRRAALIEQEASARKAAADKRKEAVKKAADEFVAEAERELILATQRGENTLAIEEKIIRRRLAADALGLGKLSKQRLLLTAKANADIAELNTKNAIEQANKLYDASQTQLSARLILARKGSQAEYDIQKQQLEDKRVLDRSTINATIEDAKLRRDKLREVDANADVAAEQLEDAFNKGVLDRKADLDQRRLQTEIDLGAKTFAVQIDNQRKQIDLEESNALALLDLEEETAKKRALLDDKLREELLVRRNQAQAKALAARAELAQQEAERERLDAIAIAEARLMATQKGSVRELQARKELLKKQFDQEIANAKLTAAEKEKIDAKYRSDRKELDEDFLKQLASDIIGVASQATDGITTALEAQSKAALNALTVQQEAAVRSAGTNADLRGRIEEQYQKKREAIEKQAARKRQRIASIENLIQTAQAGTAALELFAKNPILGALSELLILGKAAANQKLIDSQQFAKGTVLRGPSHAKGGIQLFNKSGYHYGEAEGNEIILTKGVYENPLLRAQASALNVAGGGRAFANIAGTSVPVMSEFSYGGVPQAQESNLMEVVQAIKDLNIFVNVTEIDNVKADMVKAKATGAY
ncbi:coiled-coil domain-containing protein [Spirosoma arcticum]